MPSVYVKTLGCKVNTFDGHALANQFQAQGYTMATAPTEADVTVINTCSVTHRADREARYLARRMRRESPDTMLVFTGCYAQTDSDRLLKMDDIDLVVPNEIKENLVDEVARGLTARQQGEAFAKLPAGVKPVKDNRQKHFKSSLTLFDRAESARTRAFVKVQDGCNGFCSYCLIPYARGASRSVPADAVLAEVDRLTQLGTPEIVLTGIHIGDYGEDLPGADPEQRAPILDLLTEILKPQDGPLIRISSLEPAELSEEFAELLGRHPHRVSPHFHLPLQSGDDDVLRRMRRQYDTDGYRAAVERVRRYFPEACIGADVIPGFPGESDEQFANTVAFIIDLGLHYLHVFPYSRRPNTAAARMPDHLADHVVKTRAQELRTLSQQLQQDFWRGWIGRRCTVIWEDQTDREGRRQGTSTHYLPVVAAAGERAPQAGEIGEVTIRGLVNNQRLLATLS